jgi:hypothetical protein
MNKLLPVVGIGLLAGSFMAGRYSAPEKVVTKTEIQKVEVARQEILEHSIKRKKATIKILPSGEKTVTIEDIISQDQQKIDLSIKEEHSKTSVTVENRSKFLFQGFLSPSSSHGMDYGAGLSYRVLGPISLGAAYIQNQPFVLMVGIDL